MAKKILIIDDEPDMVTFLCALLEDHGYVTITAADGEEGLRVAREQSPDLVLCDVMMPELDGHGVLRALQQDEQTATLPFIFMTAKSHPTDVRAGMDNGADDYLCKPVAGAEMLSAIRARLRKHGQQDRHVEHEVEAARLDVVRKLPHELLTPLAGLLSASQLLETADQRKPMAEVRELGRLVRLASERLHRTIHRFLLYAELELAKRDFEAQAQLRGTGYIPVTAWTTALAEHLAEEYARKADLELALPAVELEMAPAHFSELAAQLLDNAFKFSTVGSVVQVLLSFQPGGGCSLTVRDQGRGMTPEQIRQVGAFRQFDSEHLAQTGTGLGLALVGQLAALYGGKFTIESEPGNGTSATVRLPKARPGSKDSSTPDPGLRRKVARALGSR